MRHHGLRTLASILCCGLLASCTSTPSLSSYDSEGDGAIDGDTGGVPSSRGDAEYASSPGGSTGSGTGGVGAGLLTAGAFDDNLNFDVYRTFISDLQQSAAPGIPAVNLGQRAVVTVKNEAGNPVGGAVVTIARADVNAEAAPLLQMPTGTDGRVIFLTALDGAGDATTFNITVEPPGGDPVSVVAGLNNAEWAITVPGQGATTPVAQLDLAFLVDCTGSMSDELDYLQAEVSAIADTVATRFPAVAVRYALVCYRDEGDEYVIRPFDFTSSLEEFQTNLSLQGADGGGDLPEAVHKALQTAHDLSWTPGPVARVLFWIADAPPHAEYAQEAFDKALGLRSAGVRIYPVAASGVDNPAEFLMRTAAMMTGAEYIFLTDDSGIGETHTQPHIPCYVVQHLKDVFIRLITSELAGQRQYPAQEEILRTVGNPVNGVCAATQPADTQQ